MIKKASYFFCFCVALHFACGFDLMKQKCCKDSGIVLDCSNCSLSVFPSDMLRNRTTLTTLDLSNNNISHIPDGSFENLKSLKRLVLTDNPILNYNRETFRGLEALKELEMGVLKWGFRPPRLPAESLTFLKSLKVLRLFYNYETEFEAACLGGLTNLKTLEMLPTGIPSTLTQLGKEFKGLRNLRSLIMRKNLGDDFAMTDKTFENVPYLEELQISYKLTDISPTALVHFKRLSTLSLPCNQKLNNTDVFKAIKNMKSPTLTTLILDGSEHHGMFHLSVDLVDSPNFSSITHVSLKYTHLVKFDVGIAPHFINLKNLAVGYNTIYFDRQNASWIDLSKFKLEALDVSFLFRPFAPHYKKFADMYCENTKLSFRRPPSFLHLTVDNSHADFNNRPANGIWKYIPPALNYLYASHVIVKARDDVYRTGANNILYADLSNGLAIRRLPLVIGLTKLQGLDMRNSKLEKLDKDQLLHLPSLRYLNISHNRLHNMDFNALLRGGMKLEWLDIGDNDIKNISLSLQNLTALRTLVLRKNSLSDFTLSFGNNFQLERLDLSYCLMASLPSAVTKEIDDLQSRLHHQLNVDLSQNRFDCSCDTLDMITWIQNTQVNIAERSNLKCSHDNSSVNLMEIDLELMSKECQHHRSVVLDLTLSFGIGFIFLVSILIGYRYKWRLRFYIYKGRKRFINLLPSNDQSLLIDLNEYDAFIVYNESEDYEWVENELVPKISDEWGFSYCVAGMFDGGRSVFDVFEMALSRSRKIVLVVTPAFAADGLFQVLLENMILNVRRDRLIVICHEEVPPEHLSQLLLNLIESGHVEYSQEPVALRLFWSNLHDELKS